MRNSNKTQQHQTSFSKRPLAHWVRALALAGAATPFMMPNIAMAQEVEEEVIVTGTRATIQNSIDLKRDSVTIVDGLSADEIGEIPALSIGEALETITGATAHRENGGASEISVRGLGPFLGTTVVNGREATNGGGNRAVNFSIFPSEMFNKIAIHKTQSAEYIEGAVSGQIHLDTKKPLEYGKQDIQITVKGSYSPDEASIDGGQDFGTRFTASYIDQFDIGDAGSIGISIGGQLRDETSPEQEYMTGSGGGRFEACELSSSAVNGEGLNTSLPLYIDGDQSNRCETNPLNDSNATLTNANLQATIDGNPNYNSADDIPWAYIARDHRFRQNTTGNKQEALFGVIQWQPNDMLDITLDGQYSERDQTELRQDFQVVHSQQNITSLTSNGEGILYSSTFTDNEFSNYITDFQRLEEYKGFGLNVEIQATDDLKISLDASYSDTTRTETDNEIRLGARNQSFYEGVNGGHYGFNTGLSLNAGDGVGLVSISDTPDDGFSVFNPADPSFYTARDRLRLRARQQIRENTIDAVRADFELNTEDSFGFIDTLKGGFRVSSLTYLTKGGPRGDDGVNLFEDEDLDGVPGGSADGDTTDEVLANIVNDCAMPFPEGGFLEDERTGDLITVNDGTSSVGYNQWATFDYNCTANAILVNYGGISGIQYENGIDSNTIDVTEDTFAFYLQGDFETEIAGFPARGNIGVRIVDTDITSVDYGRQGVTFFVDPDVLPGDDNIGYSTFDDSNGDSVIARNGYTEILPSATLIVDIQDDLVLRTGIFKGLSRPDPNAYGNGLSVDDSGSTRYATLAEAQQEFVADLGASGNPNLKPLTSMNFDLGLEWYANDDTLISGTFYYKEFLGGYETAATPRIVNVDGVATPIPVSGTQTSDDESTIYGLELTATHAFDYLPGFLSGTGAKFSYNYADADYEFEDQVAGDGVDITVNADGSTTESDLLGIIPPAGLTGLSKHVASLQLYWQNDYVNISTIVKSRSSYFQEYTRDTQGRVRYTDGSTTVDLKASYKVLDNVTLSFEGQNLTDEPRIDYRAIEGNTLQVLSYGPTFNAGVKVKF